MLRAPYVYSFAGVVPVVDPTAFVHPSAVLIGDVIVGARCYVGPCASLRGDFGPIILEGGSNVQDGCIMHSFPGEISIVEVDGHIGHGAVLHGCRVGRNALVGMKAVVMDNAEIGENSFVGACAFVKSGMKVPPDSLVTGIPAKYVRQLTAAEKAWKAHGTSTYQRLAERSKDAMQECEALSALPDGRKSVEWTGTFPLMGDLKSR